MPISLKLPWPLFGFVRPRQRESAPDDLVLVGERITLRPLHIDDAAALYLCASDPEVTRFLPWQPANDIESVRNFLYDQVERRRRGESLGLAVLLHETLIGSVDLMGLHGAKKTGIAEIGYLLNKDQWGKGLMTEAAAVARDHGFTTFSLKTLVGFADESNIGSRRVLEKLGMRHVGEELRTVKNEERRYIRYEMSRSEWEARS
ncbi:MAG: GNAT family N-acetyltransferase [Armatimonas sp.]